MKAMRAWAVLTAVCSTALFVSTAPEVATAVQASAGNAARTISTASDPAEIGSWEAPIDIGAAGIHAALLPNGTVLLYGKVLVDGEGSSAHVFDPVTEQITDVHVPYLENTFCGGLSFLPDGRLLATGGDLSVIPGGESGAGVPYANTFDYQTNTWSQTTDMANARWYPTNVEMPDGKTLVFSGRDTRGATIAALETFDPTTSTWTTLPATADNTEQGLYPRDLLLGDGRVVMAGVGKNTEVFDPSSNTWGQLGRFNIGRREAGGAVLLPGLEKILAAGGSGTQTAEVIDMSLPSPHWQYTGSMSLVRNHMNLVLLPDGNVLSVGGGNDPLPGGDSLQPEMYDPSAGTWTLMAAEQYGREYHSSAVLLPDGRVISSGGEETLGFTTVEIYSPPYLFHGTRPTIIQAPTQIAYGAKVTVRASDTAGISKVVLMRPGAATHGFDQDQRYVGVNFTVKGATKLKVTGPASGSIAPPGYYMLFLVNSAGVPSVAKFIHVG